ncbi:hypothetical protein G3576_16640 [Roseomonas stagni]|uniref:Uncharacterized protein n=1 Tax=Falsiroseomonas algicola TaxID=2716930 RepID=A0A6M1LN96_9PROT|nr:DUF6502 family protein [Falsiroseomonas algicola]NGM21653.1 hypothetical protein [Falsiroseomonas algicola]
MSDLPAPPAAPALLRPLARLLRPLLRLMIRAGLTWPVFADLVRGLYVQVAAEEIASAAARTDSRLSLMTGVHRKEIRRLREQPPEAPDLPPVVTLHSQLVARWLGLPAFSDAAGRPLPLPRTSAAGEPSFDALVSAVTRDVRPRAVLDEWLAQGVVRLDAGDRAVLQEAAFVPRPGTEAQLHYFARNLHDHLAAATANVAGAQPAFLERAVHYDGLPPAIAERMEALGRAAVDRMLVEVNREVLAMLDGQPEPPPGTPTRRVNLGVYLYTEAETPPERRG